MPEPTVQIGELLRVFGRIGLLSFGGPAAQIALMHRELVDRRPWLTEGQFLNALSFCMLLPGPEAMQLATYCGWRLRGVPGGLISGLLFVLPGALVVGGLAALYVALGSVTWVQALFLGIKATVVVIVLEALRKLSRRALKTPDRWVLAGLSFAAIYAFQVPFPAIVGAAALYGALTARGAHVPAAPVAPVAHGGLARTLAVWTALWWLPVGLALAAGQDLLARVGLFFSQLAVVTFGGAYAVLAYMTQTVVQDHGWLTTAQMMDGLGLAETTPGPLILVTEFVGFLAGYGAGGYGLAVAAAAMTLWVTFVPCFLWIFAGAPYIDWLSGRPRLAGAMQAITAAVVGVILNLSIWFAAHVFFAEVAILDIGPLSAAVPRAASLNPWALALALLAGTLLWGPRWPLPRVLAICAAAAAGGAVFSG